MKVLVVYDSQYGNTEKVAKAIAGAIAPPHEVKLVKIGEAKPEETGSYDLLIVGAPTQGGRATTATRAFLDKIPGGSLKNTRVTSFDTRLKTILVKAFGYAAGRIQTSLVDKGGQLAAEGEGFFVDHGKGPVKQGELERAAEWAKKIVEGK